VKALSSRVGSRGEYAPPFTGLRGTAPLAPPPVYAFYEQV